MKRYSLLSPFVAQHNLYGLSAGKRVMVLSVLVFLAPGCGKPTPSPTPNEPTSSQADTQLIESDISPQPETNYLSDDGTTLWARPVSGVELDLTGTAEDTESVLFLRSGEFFSKEEGKRIWQALGPAGDLALSSLAAMAGKPVEETKRIVVSLGPGEDYGTPNVSVAVDAEATDDLPLLRREIEMLATAMPNDMHIVFLFSPKFLLGDGGGLFVEAWNPLRDLLTDLAGEDWQAAALGIHLSESFYWELRIVGTAATRETTMSRTLRKESGDWPKAVQAIIASQAWPNYSNKIIARSPKMFEQLATYTRAGTEGRQVVLNGYLPKSAGHNLVLASELLLAGLGQPVEGTATPQIASADQQPKSLEERLSDPVSLQFRRESLETALQLLSNATNIPIRIEGRDLQLEGITRNQMLGLDEQGKAAREVLVQILRRANPDPLAQGPRDERQKLIFVVRQGAEGPVIHITTRSSAMGRNETIDTAFQSESKK